MSRLYVINNTKQVQQFCYHTMENPKVQRVTIRPADQAMLPTNLNDAQIDYIIQQHQHYGFVTQEEALRTQRGTYIALTYHLDRAVELDNISALTQQNGEARDLIAFEDRKTNAASVSNTIDQQQESSDRKLLELSVEVRDVNMLKSESDRREETISVAKEGFQSKRNLNNQRGR